MSLRNILVSLALTLSAGAQAAAPRLEFKIVTAAENGTYIQIGRDLARHVAADANITLQVLATNGSVENVKRLRDEPGTKFALVQSDVYQAFLDQAASGNAEAARIMNPLRVIAPLYSEEVYVIARADSPLTSVHDIHGKRINVGPQGSGSAMTAATLYRRMFYAQIPPANLHMLDHQDALRRIASDGGGIDVAFVVAGQPAAVLSGLDASTARRLKLLKFDDTQPSAQDVLKTYAPATIKAVHHARWVGADVSAVAVRTLLVTYDYRANDTREMLARFARAMCRNFLQLQSDGHPKWREVSIDLSELPGDWAYYLPTERELRQCNSAASQVAARCDQHKQLMGLCARD